MAAKAARSRLWPVWVSAWALLAGCADGEPSYRHGLDLGPECSARYEMRVWEDAARAEPDATYWFRIDASDEVSATVRWTESGAPVEATRVRTLDLAPDQFGPSAPDAACRDRVHDPFEDFVSLTFVRFPAGAHDSSSWRGHPVRGDGRTCSAPGSCCGALACGPTREVEPNAESCQLGYWREERVPDAAAEGLVRLRSTWENGLEGQLSASATRFVDFDPRAGRTLASRVEIRPRGPDHTRRVQIVAWDRCDGIQPLAQTDPHAATWFDAPPAGSPAKPQP